MPKKPRPKPKPRPAKPKRRSSLLDTRVIFCGENLQKLADFPDASVDLIYIDPPFNSNRNYEVFWGETREKLLVRPARRDRIETGGGCSVAAHAAVAPVALRAPFATAAGTLPRAAVPPYSRPAAAGAWGQTKFPLRQRHPKQQRNLLGPRSWCMFRL